jgi:uncharacterized protein (DUF2235 family)
MTRNVVVCLDGTGNQFGEHNTNVVKLFRVLVRDHAQQLAYYDPGVGTLADPALKTPIAKTVNKCLGLAFGRGLTRNVVEAYSYVMDHYQDGDRLFLFGFSRGAYTARVLAGFLHHCGLLEPGCQHLIPYALKQYTKAKMCRDDWRIAARFKKTYGRQLTHNGEPTGAFPVHFLGLWDSVSTLGWVWDPVFLPYTTNNPGVATVRHALAIDERRSFFRPLFWGGEHLDRQDVKQVWFAGVHADIGGGYPEEESGLAKISLEWMIREAQHHGLVIDEPSYLRYVVGTTDGFVGPSPTADQHQSLAGLWLPVEVLPKTVWDPSRNRKVLKRPRPNLPRFIPREPKPLIHESVETRKTRMQYDPVNLPPNGHYDIEH